jgi:hypothetical protein
MMGSRVADLGWDLGVDLAVHQSVALELTQLQGEHLLGDRGDVPAQFTETAGAPEQVVDDQWLPLAADGVERDGHRARLPGQGLRSGCRRRVARRADHGLTSSV